MRHFLVASIALVAAPATAAAAPVPGASYGGGVPPAGYADNKLGNTIHADAHVTPDGTRARVRINAFARCGRGIRFNQRFDASGPIDATGRIVARARSRRYGGPGSAVKRPRGTGNVNLVFDGARASGTVRVRVTTRLRGRRVRCDSGVRPVELRSVAADPGTPGAAAAGASYFGTLGSAFRGRVTPIAFRVNAAGTKIQAAHFGTALSCPRTPEYLANISPPMTIRSDGTFRRTEKFSARYRNAVDRTRIVFAGRFTAQGATGTISVRQVTTLRGGGRFTCRSGTVGWNAAR